MAFYSFEPQALNIISPRLEIHHLLELTNAFVIDISESKLDGSVLNGEIVSEVYYLIRLDHARKGVGVACFIKYTVAYSYKASILLTQKVFLQRCVYQDQDYLQYRPSDKIDFFN